MMLKTKNKLLVLFLSVFVPLLSAGAIEYDDAVDQGRQVGGAAASGLGLGLIHFFNAGAIILSLIVFAVIVGYYFQKVDQEKRGVGKNVMAIIGGVFAGTLVLVTMLSLQSLIYGDGCGTELFQTYLKDAAKAGFGSYTFGDGLTSHSCLQ